MPPDRNSPQAAGVVLLQLLPNLQIRKPILSFLADTLELAHELAPNAPFA